jgi:hypothetical protein
MPSESKQTKLFKKKPASTKAVAKQTNDYVTLALSRAIVSHHLVWMGQRERPFRIKLE